jgi:hypothetical protein
LSRKGRFIGVETTARLLTANQQRSDQSEIIQNTPALIGVSFQLSDLE